MTLTAPKTIVRNDVPEPAPARGQAVIRIMRSGICGSDVHAYYGKHPFIGFPIVTGHEFSGVIEKIGEGVTGVGIGDRVTVMPQLFCGECPMCRAGRYNICESLKVIGCQAPGSSQELLAADARLILKLPDEISFDAGAMLEPLSVGVHACKRAGGVNGKKVVVLGAGTIGNLAAQSAKALGADDVMITDISAARLALAKSCGIDHTANTAEQDLAAEIRAVWGGGGADMFIECVGIAQTIGQAIRVSRKGCDIVVAGVFAEEVHVNMGLVQDKELNVTGTLMYVKEDWLEAISMVSEKRVRLEPLTGAFFPLAELGEAFRYIENNPEGALKVLITP